MRELKIWLGHMIYDLLAIWLIPVKYVGFVVGFQCAFFKALKCRKLHHFAPPPAPTRPPPPPPRRLWRPGVTPACPPPTSLKFYLAPLLSPYPLKHLHAAPCSQCHTIGSICYALSVDLTHGSIGGSATDGSDPSVDRWLGTWTHSKY